jgi:hypothetical protein
MNQQPDKLFRDKLEHFQKPISANAWSRVENNLDGRKAHFPFLKIAAAITVVVGIGWWLMSKDNPEAPREAKVQHTNQKYIEKKVSPSTEVISDAGKSLAEAKPKPDATIDLPAKKNSAHRKQAVIKKEEAVVNELLPPSENIPVVTESEPQQEVNDDANALAVQNTATLKSNTLVLSADEVNAKYLNQENLQGHATPDNKKTSTLQRLLNKVSDLKNNQDPLGDLRQKKDEILALNFKTEKQRNQNR